ncbi:MAG: DUF3105 domain-containing protein [Actinomycetota bacterium]
MAKKRKPKKRPYTPPAAPKGQAAVETAPAAPARRMHKEEARKARERALKAYRRRNRARRVITLVVVVTVIYGVFFLLTRVGTPELPDAALASAKGAGCSGLVPQPDRGGGHPAPPYVYEDKPATSGPHANAAYEAGVYGDPIPEERAVHSLEHAYVIAYYRADGPRALSDEALTAMESLGETEDGEAEEKVIVAPYPDLPAGTTLAFAAWNYLLTCPATVEAGDVTAVGQAFIDGLRGSSHAPEPNVE